MDQTNFSDGLPAFTGSINNPTLKATLAEIRHALNSKSSPLKVWADGWIALPVQIKVDLPSLGNYQDIDIRSREPVMLVFSLNQYPSIAPKVITDRLDFPKNKLAHLYIAKQGRPPGFCIVRGNMEDWYAEKRPADLLIRISNWLRDAALGELVQNGNQFDPMRQEECSGYLVYDYDQLATIIENNNSILPEDNFTAVVFKRTADSTFKMHTAITSETVEVVKELLSDAYKKENDNVQTDHYHVGYVIWDRSKTPQPNYEITFPSNWEELQTYSQGYGIDLNHLERAVTTDELNIFQGIPIILGIRRPASVIGFTKDIEFSNHMLVVKSEQKENEKLSHAAMVISFTHNQPLTTQMARTISGVKEPIAGINLAVGCGALGSKIMMHFSRSGQTNFVLADPEKISSHNMVRHALLSQQIGMNKAEALAGEIKAMYPSQSVLITGMQNFPDRTFQDGYFDAYDWIFDFTASSSFFSTLVTSKGLNRSHICKANISNKGNLGIMLIEGDQRNPRLDDLQASLYYHHSTLKWVEDWLRAEAMDEAEAAGNVSITVGVGCNSETTILADDKISTHAAFFSGVLKKKCIKDKVPKGHIYVSRITEDPDYAITTNAIPVSPFQIFTAVNDSSWQVRFMPAVVHTLKAEMGLKMPKETGGIFIGTVNYKSKTIHVVDVVTEPEDSVANEICFHRGITGLPEKVKEIHEGSGGQLGYIGEWHTHPFGPNNLSKKDLQTVSRFKSELDSHKNPLPVFLTVITPISILPYIF